MSSWIQRFFIKYFPETAKSMEADSRSWMMKCSSCGNEISYWDIGGIRWKASSSGKRVWRRCPQCGKFVGHKVYWRRTSASGTHAETPTETM